MQKTNINVLSVSLAANLEFFRKKVIVDNYKMTDFKN